MNESIFSVYVCNSLSADITQSLHTHRETEPQNGPLLFAYRSTGLQNKGRGRFERSGGAGGLVI